jgi:hypothetical protein
MTYEVIENEFGTCIVRNNPDGSQTFIPADESNADYQRYLNPDLENGTIS